MYASIPDKYYAIHGCFVPGGLIFTICDFQKNDRSEQLIPGINCSLLSFFFLSSVLFRGGRRIWIIRAYIAALRGGERVWIVEAGIRRLWRFGRIRIVRAYSVKTHREAPFIACGSLNETNKHHLLSLLLAETLIPWIGISRTYTSEFHRTPPFLIWSHY